MTNKFCVRAIAAADASRISELNAQRGYNADEATIRERMGRIERQLGHTMLGAEGPNGLVGFVHFFERPSIEKGFDLVVQALVTDEAHRGQGIGRLLMNEVENAALSRDINSIALSSRTDRKDAHAFYCQLGYDAVATSSVFTKAVR